MLSDTPPAPNYWYQRPGFAPPPIVRVGEYDGAERLCIACTQTGLSSREQQQIVRQWCALLPDLHSVRTVWLASQVPQRLFDAACSVPGLQGLWVKWSSIESLDAIGLASQLRYFHLGSAARLRSLVPLAARVELRWLGLHYLPRVETLDAISTLVNLEGLSLEGSLSATWRVRSLIPLQGLTALRYLSLAALRVGDNSLAPLAALRQLETLRLPLWWDQRAVEQLRKRNPGLAR